MKAYHSTLHWAWRGPAQQSWEVLTARKTARNQPTGYILLHCLSGFIQSRLSSNADNSSNVRETGKKGGKTSQDDHVLLSRGSSLNSIYVLGRDNGEKLHIFGLQRHLGGTCYSAELLSLSLCLSLCCCNSEYHDCQNVGESRSGADVFETKT